MKKVVALIILVGGFLLVAEARHLYPLYPRSPGQQTASSPYHDEETAAWEKIRAVSEKMRRVGPQNQQYAILAKQKATLLARVQEIRNKQVGRTGAKTEGRRKDADLIKLPLDEFEKILEKMLAEGLRNGSIPDPLEVGDRDGTYHCHLLDGEKRDYCLVHTQEMPRNVDAAIRRGRNILCPTPTTDGKITFIDCNKVAQHLLGGAVRPTDIPKIIPGEEVKDAGTIYFFTPEDWKEQQEKDFVGYFKNCQDMGVRLLNFKGPDGVVHEVEVVFIWCP